MYDLDYFQKFADLVNTNNLPKDQFVFVPQPNFHIPLINEANTPGVVISGAMTPEVAQRGVMFVQLKGVKFHLFNETFLNR